MVQYPQPTSSEGALDTPHLKWEGIPVATIEQAVIKKKHRPGTVHHN